MKCYVVLILHLYLPIQSVYLEYCRVSLEIISSSIGTYFLSSQKTGLK